MQPRVACEGARLELAECNAVGHVDPVARADDLAAQEVRRGEQVDQIDVAMEHGCQVLGGFEEAKGVERTLGEHRQIDVAVAAQLVACRRSVEVHADHVGAEQAQDALDDLSLLLAVHGGMVAARPGSQSSLAAAWSESPSARDHGCVARIAFVADQRFGAVASSIQYWM